MREVVRSVAAFVAVAGGAIVGSGACGGDDLGRQARDAGVDAGSPVLDGSAPDASDGGVTVPCSGDGLSLCAAGRCSISGAASSLPPGAVVTLADQPLDPALSTDALLPYQCSVQLPTGVGAGAAAFTLRMEVPGGTVLPPAGAVMFAWVSPVATALTTSGVAVGAVEGVLTASGIYAATAARVTPTLTTQLGTDPRSSADFPSLVRNVTGGTTAASFYDGTRLYLGSGGRVLIYAHGIPADPTGRSGRGARAADARQLGGGDLLLALRAVRGRYLVGRNEAGRQHREPHAHLE